MKLKVYGQDGSETGRSVTLDKTVFSVEPNDHAIWLDVRAIQANARQGTHKTKERSEVSGGGAKPWRQKGTGRARAGTSRSPLWVGGGRTFGPRPHKYTVGINRKTKQVARRSAYTYKAQAKSVKVIEDFSMDAPRTKNFVEMLAALELGGQKVLLLTDTYSENVYKSGRNIPKISVKPIASASTEDVLGAEILLVQESALKALSTQLGTGKKKK